MSEEFPACVCGHASEEHHYSPSGCGTSHCEYGGMCECGHHESNHWGFPSCGEDCKCTRPNLVVPYCPCREYEPDEPCYNCGHPLSAHEVDDLDCLATVQISVYPERPCECARYITESDAEEQWLAREASKVY